MKERYSYADFYSAAFGGKKDDFNLIAQFVEGCPDGTILEIGAGTGRTIGAITSRRHALLEPDADMLRILRSRARNAKNIEIHEGLCPGLPFEDQSHAGVFAAFGTIGEINPICVTLQEIWRVLRPGGRAMFHAINPEVYASPALGI